MTAKICIIGLGYIGLPTAAVFADNGYKVIGVDINKEIVDNLNKGKIIITEPHLDKLVRRVVDKKNLIGVSKPCEADVFIICVPTPIGENKKADLKYVIDATSCILPYLKKGSVVILESTSPVGTTKNIIKNILKKSNLDIGKDVYLGYSPERVLPGKIIEELINNHRVVGGINEVSAIKIKQLYETFVKGEIYMTDTDTAELVKLIENTFRDINIAFANELAQICDSLEINVWDVIKYANKHPRVNILNPGPGVGGHCLAVDPWFIVESRPDLANLIKLSRNINDYMPQYMFKLVKSLLKDDEDNKKITILGATYKPDIDDVRESPITKLINLLKENDYEVCVYDPYVNNLENKVKNLNVAVKNSNLLILGVGHSIFKNIDFKELLNLMNSNILLDTINFLNKEDMINIGFKYVLLGDKNEF
ncbi:nucleotide sugar dehydrogenase [Romboutsia lituseburensis]|uniref:nucleotide sugar dehydrogenase n=1 Tax=Romboutsia lituseburensis TaxID=1537 RepID=UPI00215A5D17|nr:nucleotide sugar dehydrogenase [Romboutsia lituseburensis]MCR8744698.1 nucleotide sugar dehydrogenase [Romboutsia lituseburensis]